MGCDISLKVEVKVKGKWLLFNQPRVDRNYELFEKMAGVRGDVSNAISEPKGLPDDISEGTKLVYEYEKDDAHSESYLTLLEIGLLEKWYEEQAYEGTSRWFNSQFGYLFGNGYNDTDELNDPPIIEDVRFVFWFDN